MDAGALGSPTLGEVARFLARRPPFDALAPGELGELVRDTEVEFHAAGMPILTEDGGPVTFLRVIHSGAVDIVHADKLLDLLGPGDTFGHAAMLSGLPPGFEARAAEDTLCYRIPVGAARLLLERARNRELPASRYDPGGQVVATLIRSPTVRCAPETTVREVARRITEAGATAAIVDLRGGELGILTDRDIRSRVVAEGLALDTPVARAMTTPVFTVRPERLGREVLFELLERGIRHAPVLDDTGRLIGVVEDADLFPFQPQSWFGVQRSIARARSEADLEAASARLPGLSVELHESSLRAVEVGRVLSAMADALTVRALELASEDGPEPEGLVWIAVGSQARRELLPASRQRGAIVHHGAPDPDWLSRARRLLAVVGVADVPAPRSTGAWQGGDPRDELTLEVLVERRPLWGTPSEPLPALDRRAQPAVLAALARRARSCVPPTGFDGAGVLGADGARSRLLDIRLAAIMPIVELGRWSGALAGCVDGSTPDRLATAGTRGVLREADARSLRDAFELALEVRLVHHAECIRAGAPPDDAVDPGAMSPLARDHLRDVFRAVAAVQRALPA